MRRRGFLAALFALPFVRRLTPAWTLYNSTPRRFAGPAQAAFYDVAVFDQGKPVSVKRYHFTKYSIRAHLFDG